MCDHIAAVLIYDPDKINEELQDFLFRWCVFNTQFLGEKRYWVFYWNSGDKSNRLIRKSIAKFDKSLQSYKTQHSDATITKQIEVLLDKTFVSEWRLNL